MCTRTHLGIVLGACFSTYLLVVSGLDWEYFLATYNKTTRPFLFFADGLGFLIPVFLPILLYVFSVLKKNLVYKNVAFALASAAALGFVVSMAIKSFTGRISPPHHGPFDVDISHMFQFGFMEHHIIGGWPSSHAMVMFALASCLYVLFPRVSGLHILAFGTALFVGVGVTFGFHWLSELVAGACFGFIIGRAVGKAFMKGGTTAN